MLTDYDLGVSKDGLTYWWIGGEWTPIKTGMGLRPEFLVTCGWWSIDWGDE